MHMQYVCALFAVVVFINNIIAVVEIKNQRKEKYNTIIFNYNYIIRG